MAHPTRPVTTFTSQRNTLDVNIRVVIIMYVSKTHFLYSPIQNPRERAKRVSHYFVNFVKFIIFLIFVIFMNFWKIFELMTDYFMSLCKNGQ